jgi:hypothetical protein
MFGNSRNSNISSVNAWNPFARRRTVFSALILALTFGSMGQTPAAQAAPAGDLVNFYLWVLSPKTTLRCGETVTYQVAAGFVPVDADSESSPAISLDADSRSISLDMLFGLSTDIDAMSGNPTVGDFVVAYKGSKVRSRLLLRFQGPYVTNSGGEFKFKANKPGKTTLYFQGFIGETHQFISNEVKVTVLPCHFQIKTLGDYNALDVNLAALMDREMKSDEQGNITGSGTVNWVGDTLSSGDCSSAIDVASSKAELTGSLDESGQLIVNVTYLPAVLTNVGKCENAQASLPLNDQALVTPDPVHISIATSGGVSTRPQDLYEPNYYAMHGSVDIVVIPVEDEAVTFIQGDPEARWDDFSRLFGTLLALH